MQEGPIHGRAAFTELNENLKDSKELRQRMVTLAIHAYCPLRESGIIHAAYQTFFISSNLLLEYSTRK